jgi:PAT family beta-lactamase induction signal transducer AmpG
MLPLGFSSGLPLLLIFSTQSAWLREAGVSRPAIWLMSYAALAFTFKFAWAPFFEAAEAT